MSRFQYLIVAILLLILTAAAGAQTIIIPEPPQHGRQIPMPYIQQTHVSVQVDATLAKTTVELTVYNPGERIAEGTLLFPLPAQASVSDFYLWIGGEKVKGELLDKDQAKKIYQDIVRRMVDPALLEMTKYNVFKASIFPIEAKKTRKISITYSENLQSSNGLIHYSYLMKNRQLGTSQPMESFSFEASVNAPVPITTVYSPSHDMEINRQGERSVRTGFEKSDYSPERDMQLYIGYSADQMAVYATRYSAPGEDRDYGMFILSPTPEVKTGKKVNKDVVFVLDTSGSMQHDEKIDQAVNALKFGLGTLGEDDRFTLLTFATDVRSFTDTLVPASQKYINDARQYLSQSVSATGSTNIHDALKRAFSLLSPGDSSFDFANRSRYIIFLTDGLPTAVERDPQVIIKRAKEWAPESVRLFTWGVGYDVDTILLDSLSSNHGGVSEYVKPREEMEAKLGDFFQKISYPVMTNLQIAFKGIKVEEMYPRELPDIFKGSQLTVFARLSGGSSGTVTLQGNYLGEQQTFTYDLEPVAMEEGDHIAHLWATRKVGFLLEEIRTNGQTPELKQAVIDLARKHGIVTPYTSYLVTEPEADYLAVEYEIRVDAESGEIVRKPVGEAKAPTARSGEQAVQYSQQVRKMKEEGKAAQESDILKTIAGKTFRISDETWIDTEFEETMTVKEIKFGSDEYFELVDKDKRMASWLSAGKQVIIVYKDVAYKIVN